MNIINESKEQTYCLTFLPVISGIVDPVGAEQIFFELTEEKAESLEELLKITNKDNQKLKILIEKFKISK